MQFNYTRRLAASIHDDRFVRLMQFEAGRAHEYFRRAAALSCAKTGVRWLAPRSWPRFIMRFCARWSRIAFAFSIANTG